MKRIAALKALSIDHHHGLVLARKAKKTAAKVLKKTELLEIWIELQTHGENVLIPHFKIEESYIAAALNVLNDPDVNHLANRLFSEHETLRQLLFTDDVHNSARLKQFGELLEQHIRFEERELFEVVQTKLDDQTLRTISAVCFTQNHK